MAKDIRLSFKGIIKRPKNACPEVHLKDYPFIHPLVLPVTSGIMDYRELEHLTIVDITIRKERKKK